MIIRKKITKDYLLKQLKNSRLDSIRDTWRKYNLYSFNLDKRKKYKSEFKELINNIEELNDIAIDDELNKGYFFIKNNEKWYKVNYSITFCDDHLCCEKIYIYCYFTFEIYKEIIDKNGNIKEIVFISEKY